MQFKEIGNLFGKGEFASVFNGGGLKANNFKTASSIRDMENITAKMFNKQFHIGDDGISEWNKSQIEAKANAIGLTDSLKNEVLAMASDANMTDKLRSGKLTWSKAIDTAGDSLNDVGDLLLLQRKRILRPTGLLKNQTLQKRNQVLVQTQNPNPIQILSHLNQQKNLKNY